MAFDFLKDFAAKRREEFMSHVSPEIQTRLAEKPSVIDFLEYKRMRLNSYERKYVYSHLAPDVFLHDVKYCMEQAGVKYDEYKVHSVYDDHLMQDALPELLRRYQELLTAKPMYSIGQRVSFRYGGVEEREGNAAFVDFCKDGIVIAIGGRDIDFRFGVDEQHYILRDNDGQLHEVLEHQLDEPREKLTT